VSPACAAAGRADVAGFLAAQAHAIIVCDFLVAETLLLKRLHVLVFIEHGTRRVHVAGVTPDRGMGGSAGPEPGHAPG
jgi:hypothetical protein